MDRFEAMSILLAVVEGGSLSAAGRALRIPVPTVSRKLTDLEVLLGTRLLIRSTRKLILTDAGVGYVAAARRILEQLDDAEREAAGEFTTPKGELVITAPLMFGRLHVLPVVADFLASFPDIDVRLSLSDRNLHLVDDHVDMAVRIGRLPDSGLMATNVGAMPMVVCATPSLLAGYGMPTSPDELDRLPCVSLNTQAIKTAWQFKVRGEKHPFEQAVSPRFIVSSAEAAADAARRDVGATQLLRYQVADSVDAGILQVILADFEIDPLPVNLVHAGRGQLPLKMRRFLDFAAPRLRQVLARFGENCP